MTPPIADTELPDPVRDDAALAAPPGLPVTRRVFLAEAGLAGGAVLAPLGSAATAQPAAGDTPRAERVALRITVNGAAQSLQVDTRTTLLDLLRETLGLAGTKKGCDHGQCGACTVLLDGRRINACLALALQHDGATLTTIEGLARGDALHPLQAAFIAHDGFQCGYCTPGQICSAIGMLDEAARGAASFVTADVRRVGQVALSDREIRERLSGNLCRCGAYPGIVAAVKEVALPASRRRARA